MLGATPAASRRCGRPGDGQRSLADRAPGGGAAALAGQGGGIAEPRRLDEHGTGRQPLGDGVVDALGQPRRARVRVAAELGVAAARNADGDPLAQRSPRQRQLVGPARAKQLVGLDRSREAAEERRRALETGTQQQRLAGVGVGRPRVGVEVVAVVPDDHEAQVVDGREGRGPGADHDAALAPRHGQEVAVAARRPALGLEADVVSLAQDLREGPVDPGDVLGVGDADEDAAATPARAGVRRRGRVGEQQRPVGTGRCRPHGVRVTAGREVLQERLRRGVLRPGRVCRVGVEGRWAGGGTGWLALGGGVAWWDGEAEHVAAGAGVTLGEVGGEVGHGRAQHPLRADHPPQRGQAAGVVGGGHAFHEVAEHLLPGEAHLDPAAGNRSVGQGLRDQVVERSVQVRQRQVDEHPGHRVDRRRLDGDGRLGLRLPGPGRPHRRPEPGQRLGLGVGGAVGHGRSSTSGPTDRAQLGAGSASFLSVWLGCNDAEPSRYPADRVSRPVRCPPRP